MVYSYLRRKKLLHEPGVTAAPEIVDDYLLRFGKNWAHGTNILLFLKV